MPNKTPNSWEEELSQQTENVNMNQGLNDLSNGDTTDATDSGSVAKTTTAKPLDKSRGSIASASGKSSVKLPGRSILARGNIEAAKAARAADAVAKAQQADVDDATLKEIYGEKREHVNVVFIGHVDAGKSTLGGSLLYCTGMVDDRTMEKVKREAKEAGCQSWYMSWVLDLTEEERTKGKTVSYVPHMIGGASQADLACLVISARKGEYETGFEKGGQTREHALLACNSGVQKLVIVVNKMDDPTVDWCKARFDQCTAKVIKFLEALGYKKKDILCMPVSAQRTLGIKERIPKDVCHWYNGPSLLEYLTDFELPERKINSPFMMPVTSKYRDMGTMCEGRVESGVIKKNSSYLLMPNKTEVLISALYGETENEISTASAGDQVRLRLRGVEEEDLLPGFVLCSPKRPVHCVHTFEAKIRILDLKNILTAGFNCVMHVHSAVEEVTFAQLLHKLESGTGRKSKRPPSFVNKGQTIIARLEVTSAAGAVCVEEYTTLESMGRFTLRDQGQTIAIGMITKLILGGNEH
ncbi:Eukaryotic peptide chain release factor GTP-binding subunit [Penicillium angulare]|uniref:Eukaryotic peptide chain release factor GTP-binding subunit n=1 Tax=Penicillium angulare TaxID=116970 RepID=UPI00253F9E62|nr:Eukaryotic peptide chain release factor GTP-binding subunit [Penicillium angulare]KAJ5292193.1 Eukaryotic peptide chain release factor GTP-binding subunit [Penicillium angulare]